METLPSKRKPGRPPSAKNRIKNLIEACRKHKCQPAEIITKDFLRLSRAMDKIPLVPTSEDFGENMKVFCDGLKMKLSVANKLFPTPKAVEFKDERKDVKVEVTWKGKEEVIPVEGKVVNNETVGEELKKEVEDIVYEVQ